MLRIRISVEYQIHFGAKQMMNDDTLYIHIDTLNAIFLYFI